MSGSKSNRRRTGAGSAVRQGTRRSSRRTAVRGRGGPGCFSVLLFGVLVAAALFAVTAIFFRVENIEVVGVNRYRTDEVRDASGIMRGDNLVFIGKISAAGDIRAKLPYVEDVHISRDFPDTVHISVVETYASAYIEVDEDNYWLINPAAKLLERVRKAPEELLKVTGIELDMPTAGKIAVAAGEDTAKVESLVAVLDALDRSGMLSAVSSVALDGVYDVSMIFLDRFTVELGMPEQLDYKLEFLLEIVDRLDATASGVIDMSTLVEDGEARFRQYSE